MAIKARKKAGPQNSKPATAKHSGGRGIKAALRRYRAKRDFASTAEPSGGEAVPKGKLFIVQKHAASHLHYDFRLELDGVLKSWAVAKGPSVDPAVKRLAVEVEDHPLAYGGFEGTIPKGQYGGGTVMLWDRGRWTPSEDPRRGLKAGRLKFTLSGDKMQGAWALVRMKPRPQDRNPNWLLIKDKDDAAQPGDADALLKRDKSVKTGRSMDAIATGDDVWVSNRAEKTTAPAQSRAAKARPLAVKLKPATPKKAQKKQGRRPPSFIAPELATRVPEPPSGDGWLHEIKFDGYRLHCVKDGDVVRILTRHEEDWTAKFPALGAALAKLDAPSVYLDGEAVVVNKKGQSDFGALQNWFTTGEGRFAFYAFDLLFLDGADLRQRPLTERKAALKPLVDAAASPVLLYSDHQVGDGEAFFAAAARMGLEGIVCKKSDAPYQSGRGRDWLKVKRIERQEFVIGGFMTSTVSDDAIGALLLGEYEDGRLTYVGKVGTGYTAATAKMLFKRLKALQAPKFPFTAVPREARRGATWVKPELVAEIEFGAWTADHILRHAAFMGLREDKAADEVTEEKVVPLAEAMAKPKKRTAASAARKPVAAGKKNVGADVLGIAITHPEREYYPAQHVTKADIARYYAAVAEMMLPHVSNRPLALVRCPDGVGAACFFQKHAGAGLPGAIREERIGPAKDDTVLLIDSAEGLVSLVQRGVLEVHVWGTHQDHIEQPDLLVFDFDPDPAVKWPAVVKGAFELRDLLSDLGLESFVKTTGGKGLHVVLPIQPLLEWDAIKEFTKKVATQFAARAPERFLVNMSKKARQGRIFVDYLRNGRGATAVAPYSTRARPGAQIATPVTWKELKDGAVPADFTIATVQRRIAGRFKDPWGEMLRLRQSITAKTIKALG